MPQGKLIVIDGTDGSGKKTQTEILINRLRQINIPVEPISFPQYGAKSCGPVEEYLNGKYGEALDVGPYRGSILYAVDRYDASFRMRQWLEQGKVIIADRYVSANMGHQAGKIKDPEERKRFLDWLYDLEYNHFAIPKPDANIILHVSPEINQQLVDQKGHRDYVGGQKRDIHEADIEHLRDAEQAYLDIAQLPGFTLIKCTRDNQIMTREEIHDLIWAQVQKIL
jgi:dTMP kinase